MYELDFWTIKWSLPQVPDQHIITEFLSYLRNLIETRKFIFNLANKGRFFHGPDDMIIDAFENVISTVNESITTTIDLINHYGLDTFEYGYSARVTAHKLSILEFKTLNRINKLYMSLKTRTPGNYCGCLPIPKK